MNKHVYYWQACVNAAEFVDHARLIDNILLGVAEVDKMAQYRIYKSRINAADRILWTTVMVDGKPCMLVLDVILNHDYRKSRFLKKGVLEAYLEKRGPLTFEGVHAEEEALPDALDWEPARYYPQAYYYDESFIAFNAEQDHALQLPMPVVISGPAGSGKSCVLFEAMRVMWQAKPEDEKKAILYVAKSPFLAAHYQRMWDAEPDDRSVLFCSYDALIVSLDAACTTVTKVGEAYFFKWLDSYIEGQSRAVAVGHGTSKIVELFLRDKEAVYQEFQLIAAFTRLGGVFTPNDYFALGARQSLFPSTAGFNPKPALLDAYASFKAHFSGGMWDPVFHELHAPAVFYAVVVDEALDLPLGPLMTLYDIATDGRIHYAVDSHQRSRDRLSHRPLLLEMLARSSEKPVSHVQLSASYRCPNAVIRMTNAVIALKHTLTGGLSDRHEISHIPLSTDPEKELGEVFWYQPSKNEDQVLQGLFPSTYSAVVTLEEHLAEAQARYPEAIIHTPENIKGLSYRFIVAYRLLDDVAGHFNAANSALGQYSDNEHPHAHRAKKGHGDERFAPVFNGIIIAITRATEKLYFVQNKRHGLRHIIPKWRHSMGLGDVVKVVQVKAVGGNTKQDWHALTLQLLRTGNEEQAAIIFHRELNATGMGFEAFKIDYLDAGVKKTASAASDPRVLASAIPLPDCRESVELCQAMTEVKKTKWTQVSSSPKDDHLEQSAVMVRQHTGLVKLLQDFNAENLSDWLSGPHGLESLSWAVGDRGRRDDGSLFEYILNSPQRVKLLCEFLKNTERSKSHVDWIGSIAQTLILPLGATAMHLAAAANCAELITLFDARGLDIDKRNERGLTPLFIAIFSGHLSATRACVQGGASLERYVDGRAALHLAIICNRERSHLGIISLILKARLERTPQLINWPTRSGESPLVVAVDRGDMDVAKMLLKCGADVNIATRSGEISPLFIAASAGNLDMVNLLLESGAHIDHTIYNGMTALMVAVLHQHLVVVMRLVQANANVMMKSKDCNEDAFDLSKRLGNRAIQKVIVQRLKQNCVIEQCQSRGAGASPMSVSVGLSPLIEARERVGFFSVSPEKMSFHSEPKEESASLGSG